MKRGALTDKARANMQKELADHDASIATLQIKRDATRNQRKKDEFSKYIEKRCLKGAILRKALELGVRIGNPHLAKEMGLPFEKIRALWYF